MTNEHGSIALASRPTRCSIATVLRAAAADDAADQFENISDETLRWAVDGGLGPLLCRLTPRDSRLTASSAWPDVVGADLLARMRSAAQMQALEDVLDAYTNRLPPVTLLKGISLCSERYPAPHLRPMGDIDILVEPEWMEDAERLVRGLGYRSVKSPALYRTHHHIAPLVHPETDVWIELHHALFVPQSALASDVVFSAPTLRAERRPSVFRGRPVQRLSNELEVVYLPAHWAQSPALLLGADGIQCMLDMMLILRDADSLRWSTVLRWLDGAAAATHVYLMLAYLDARRLAVVEPMLLDSLRRRQSALGPIGLRLAFALLDRYVVDGQRRRILMGDRSLSLIWTALLERGGGRGKAKAVSSRLRASAERRWAASRPR